MISFFIKLVPTREESNSILYRELDDVTSVHFFTRGSIDIGFELNRNKVFVLRKSGPLNIGDFNCTFNKDSEFIFKIRKTCEGFLIINTDW